uniref:Ovule protein n=1 Tax=Caenorhabditis tropicalis TaxID=1561998 RepID=A0A1I7TJI0_9PELO
MKKGSKRSTHEPSHFASPFNSFFNVSSFPFCSLLVQFANEISLFAEERFGRTERSIYTCTLQFDDHL